MATKPKPKKSKVAAKSLLTLPSSEVKKRAAHPGLPPPTPREVKERSTKRTADKQRERIGRRFENSGSESEDSEDLPIISVKRAKQSLTTTPDAPIERSATAVTDVDVGSDQDTIPARGGELDNHPRDQGTSNPRDQSHTTTTSKKKGASSKKARLVSYSSQGDSQDETSSTTSRRSGRKRTAVTRMGGVMIDFINQNKEGKK